MVNWPVAHLEIDGDPHLRVPTPDRETALARLQKFVGRAGRSYAKFRNFDLGPDHHAHVSRLSPYVRHRLLLEREILRMVLEHHTPAAADKFMQEVFWRTYFKGWLEQHPDVWRDYRNAVENLVARLEADPCLNQRYVGAIRGQTGIACFDGCVNELIETGYLHNHTRMWFASIWVFTLGLPWQLGADFFYRHLLDGDPASNTLGWRWVCGLHTKGKVYLARAANIAKFTDGRFNPEGQLATEAKALSESRDLSPVTLPNLENHVVAGPYGLLLTMEDGHSESLPLIGPPEAIAAVTATENRSPLPISPIAESFSAGAVADASQRAERAFGKQVRSLSTRDWPQALADWAEDAGLATVVTAYAPVGPCAALLAEAQTLMQQRGIKLVHITREFDRMTWPHAGKGYFKLKNKIPGLLSELEIA
jgi:deoxyribodipyrimidine photo-lyase